MLSKLKPKSDFSKNVLTLMTGTTIAQVIPIAISPILTRIYSPENFGVFALFIAISSIVGSIANGRYELAIMLPKKDEDAINIFALGFIITACISLVLLILVILFNDYFTQILNNDEISLWLYFVPLTVFFTGLYNILNYYNNRKKQYKDLATANIIKSIVTAVIQLSVGFMKSGVTGLISGQIISQFFANTKLLKNIFKDKVLISRISKEKIIEQAKRYKDFPKYSMWAILANTLSHNLTNILISSFYNTTTLGIYSLVQRLLGMPSSLIGGAIAQVFFQQAIKEKHETGTVINSFKSAVKKLTMISLPFFLVLFFIVEDLFAFVFGEEWRIAGIYAKIILPLFFVRFIVSGVSSIYDIYQKLRIELYWQLLMLLGGLLILYIYKNDDFEVFLNKYVIFIISMQLISLFLMVYFIKEHNDK